MATLEQQIAQKQDERTEEGLSILLKFTKKDLSPALRSS